MEIGTMYWIMKGHQNCFGYLIQQNMIELSKKDMMLPYGGLITRLIHAYDIVIPPDEEVMKLDRFNVINKNLLRRLRCTFINETWIRLPRRTDPLPPDLKTETPIFRDNQNPPTSPFKATPPVEQAPSSSTDDIRTRMDQFE